MTRAMAYNADTFHENFSDLAELRAFARGLISQWERVLKRTFVMKSEFAQASGPIIWSYTNHVVELMRTVLDLSEQNRMVIAAPLIRLMVENTMTSIWLYLEPGNARAIIHEGFRLRRAAVLNILEAGAQGFDTSNLETINQVLEDFADSDLPGGRHFEKRCREIADGLRIYCSWRVMSSFSHAGMAMGDFYLEEIEAEPGLALKPDATLDHHEAWLGTATCMMIASLQACNEIDGRGSLKAQLKRAAKKMGISLNFATA